MLILPSLGVASAVPFGSSLALAGPLAPVSGPQVDKKAYVAALKMRDDSYELLSQFQVGSELCVQTQEDDVAVLRIVSLPGPGSPEFVYAYTVWQ